LKFEATAENCEN